MVLVICYKVRWTQNLFILSVINPNHQLSRPSVAVVLCRVTRSLCLEALRYHLKSECLKMVHEQLHQLSCSSGKLYFVYGILFPECSYFLLMMMMMMEEDTLVFASLLRT